MEVAYQTDVGQQRQNNQDYVGFYTNQRGVQFAIVADGMGGHLGGDVASEMAVSHIGHEFEKTDDTDIEAMVKWLIFELQRENQHILAKANQYDDLSGMGTTLVAVLISGTHYLVANIGDSRVYRLRRNTLRQLTEDHSLVNELVKQGELTAEAAKHHPQKNIITRTLGVSQEVDADVTIYEFEPDDYLLLCTDGLTSMVDDDQLQQTLMAEMTLEEKCAALIQKANEVGGMDNITALILHHEGEVPTP
ncbi:Stp1/IreP family PP2C-type Ser/Thr phosphatase [Latilactobacillus sakei]